VLAWLEETGEDWADTNVNRGAIAHGHPLGATGAALLTKLVHELERTGQDVGLSTMCIGFGQGDRDHRRTGVGTRTRRNPRRSGPPARRRRVSVSGDQQRISGC
jgi:hypothetical protein